MANEVEIVVKTTDKTDFSGISRKADGLTSSFGRVRDAALGFLSANVIEGGFRALTGFVGDSITAASDLGESMNAVSKIFGTAQDQILEWGRSNANSFGLSQRAFNELAVPLGAGLKNAGISLDDTASLTIALTERASDMASVFNTDVSEALEAIQAGLRGEADPLEQFGVGLSAAAVEARALADTGKDNAAALTDQEKALARVNLIMDQTNATAGDFADTSDQLANSQRIAAARTEELQAELGEKLLPIQLAVTEAKLALVSAISDHVLPALENMAGKLRDDLQPALEWVRDNGSIVAGALAGIGAVLLATVVPGLVASAAAAVAAAAPFVALAAAAAAIGAGLVWAYENIGPFREAVDTLTATIRDTAITAWEEIKDLWDSLPETWETVKTKFGELRDDFATKTEEIRGTLSETWETIKTNATEAWTEIKEAVLAVVGELVTLAQEFWAEHGEQIKEDLEELAAKFDEKWQEISDAVLPVLEEIQAVVETVLPIIKDVIVTAFTAIADFLSEHGDAIIATLATAWELISAQISGALDIITGIIQVGLGLIQGDWTLAWEGIQNIASGVWEAIGAFVETSMNAIWQTILSILESINADWAAKLEEIVTRVKDDFNSIVDFVAGLPGRISSAAAGIWEGLKNGLQPAIAFIVRQINTAISAVNALASAVPGIPSIPSIPVPGRGGGGTGPRVSSGGLSYRAHGGGGRGLTWVGERGPELADLGPGSFVHSAEASAALASEGSGVTVNVNVHVEGSIRSDREVVGMVYEALRKAGLDQFARNARLGVA